MDMWDPYIASVREHLPAADGKIVFDKFHVAKHLGDAVDKVRRKENKTLRAAGDDRLAGTRYDWLRNPASMEPKDRKEFAELRNSELKTARAWALKETAMALYEYFYEQPARKHPMVAPPGREEPLATDDRSSPNAQTAVRDQRQDSMGVVHGAGFRNRENFVHAIYFHCGGLDLAP